MKASVFAATFALLAALVLLVGVPPTGIAEDQRGVDVGTSDPVRGGCVYIGGRWVCW